MTIHPLSHLSTSLSNQGYRIQHEDRKPNPPSNHQVELPNVQASATVAQEGDIMEEEAASALFSELFAKTEAKLGRIFGEFDEEFEDDDTSDAVGTAQESIESGQIKGGSASEPRKPVRAIDEDYDDDDEEDEEDDSNASPLKNKGQVPLPSPPKSGSSPASARLSKLSDKDKSETEQSDKPKTAEDVRKQLEESKRATEEAVKKSFSEMFWLLDADKDAMLEQQKLEETEKAIDAEMDGNGHGGHTANGSQQGTLSSANLGASSLTLKHLIARIDAKRDRIQASDAELRSLMNEMRKNRSKWANEDQVGQEELYEAAEKVLSELKAMTEYSAPFLTRVNKREAPDYYNIIKHPMDLGTMTKKLKSLQYKSKTEFVNDLDLIWSNCLKYNGDVNHPLRRNANGMRKEAEKLVPLIPDLVIRPRAEVEAEERRKQHGADVDDGDESDDEPIISSRGRKAPAKTAAKGVSQARKMAPAKEDTPDVKPPLPINGTIANLIREGSEYGHSLEGSQNGFATPPLGGSVTPGGANGTGTGSQADMMDIDGPSILTQAIATAAEDMQESEEYKIWKQVTKKDRAIATKERYRLFRGDKLNPDEAALLRSKAGMRRWIRQHDEARQDTDSAESRSNPSARGKDGLKSETLAEGLEGEEARVLPDYYDALSAIPDIAPHLQWINDSEGHAIEQSKQFLHMAPHGQFTAVPSLLTSRIEDNMKQMQQTRKICSRIAHVKQVQIQQYVYTSQMPSYKPEPFVEADIEPHVTYDGDTIMAPWVVRAALQRSVGKLCYQSGFEEFQPSALEVITDLAGDYLTKVVKTFVAFRESSKIPATGVVAESGELWQERYSNEESLLLCLSESGLDIDQVESYAKEDNERQGTKLAVMHERMKAHYAEMIRLSLDNTGPDGAGAFDDGSEQFIGGDFAEDLNEDFFGFRELGLAEEFGMTNLSVPLHLLQSRIHHNHQLNNATAVSSTASIFENLEKTLPITKDNIQTEIGMIKNFFLAKLHANSDEPLVEDEDLPPKHRPPKPRLPPTGKITSPRKRPLKEQAGNAKKKKKLENGTAMDVSNGGKGVNGSPEKGKDVTASAKKLKTLSLGLAGGMGMERNESSQGNASQTERDDGSAVGMMSPESIER